MSSVRRVHKSSFWGHSLPTEETNEISVPTKQSNEEDEEESMSLLEQIVLEERRALARAAGRSIAEIEEEVSLQSALEQSTQQAEDNVEEENETSGLLPILFEEDNLELDEEEESQQDSMFQGLQQSEKFLTASNKSIPTALSLGLFAPIPDDIIIRSLEYNTPETVFYTATVCREWTRLVTSEEICEHLCRRCYGRRTRHFRPEKWQGWRGMLTSRPRPRVGGLYALRESRWRKVSQQDMFLPHELKGIFHVEAVWWRVLRFFDDGTVAYALINGDQLHSDGIHDDRYAAIQAATKLFKHKKIKQQYTTTSSKEKAYFGQFSLQKNSLQVKVSLPHAILHFHCSLQSLLPGHFNCLRLFKHIQYDTSGQFPLEHELPSPDHDFKFVKIASWS